MSIAMRTFVAWCVLVGCTSGQVRDPSGDPVGPDASVAPDATPAALQFRGIETAEYRGGDALTARWSPATGAGAIEYTLHVTAVGGGPVAEQATADTTVVAGGLPDGEYELRVEASDSLGRRDDGGVVVVQLVGENRVVYRSKVPLSGAADVWGEGDIVVLAGMSSALSFLVADVSDVHNPVVIAEVAGEGFVKDVKIGDGLLYVNDEAGTYGGRIFDFANPAEPVRLSRIGSPITSVHNLYYYEQHLYMTDNNSGGIRIVDVSDPTNPRLAANWYPPSSVVHDQVVIDDKLYAAWWSGFSVTDVSDPTSPKDLIIHRYDGFATDCHNVWPTEDGTHVITTDETGGGHIRIWDISDADDVVQVAEWWTDPAHIVHNAHVRGDYVFISYYVDGMRVLDISDPAEPTEVGWWDEESGSGMNGTWGVWPYGNHVAIGSMTHGLIMVDFFPHVVSADGSWRGQR
jgi:choice-of-anchor B domain-containing protein